MSTRTMIDEVLNVGRSIRGLSAGAILRVMCQPAASGRKHDDERTWKKAQRLWAQPM